ncbi:peptide chain release factor N(5)-glutamine methyltransferase [Chamaesiphon sp. VAR_69_metabat_338]|uniref:peptide chain release factor N(5)-glutamine methyltransferase n=1 Tax=Chamaesiphon sp. VAR_69_metabat_338 TaxID=2964704 RepID=UPI00286DEB9A|nr:peptide chain release factor N(5)-glutamine methyltransferase [Chamaesiphon sp. VAR_69_metabat_338]
MAVVRITGRELWTWRKWALDIATVRGISDREVDWLLQSVADLDRLTLRLESIAADGSIEMSIPLDRLSALWLDRVDRDRPVQYLIGKTFWRDFELIVSPAVLIPRPETESIIDIAIEFSNSTQQQGIWVDLGTGSGAIAIGLAKTLLNASIYAVDCSPAALDIARLNATQLGVLDRIQFSHGNWWSSLTPLQGKVAGMLSNPPYIPSAEVLQLQPEVANHEPHLALDGGSDGLDAIRILVDTAPTYLQAGGLWLIEMMAGQGAAVADLLARQGSYTDIQIIDDLAGLDRFACARLRD